MLDFITKNILSVSFYHKLEEGTILSLTVCQIKQSK